MSLTAKRAGDYIMQSVLEHQAGRLQDDASIVLVEWRTGREDQLIL